MKQIKTLVLKRVDSDFFLLLVTALGFVLLVLRVKMTQSFFYTFLIWNLLLAWFPYGMYLAVKSMEKPSKSIRYLITAVWLLFLPNAPYIITDFVHLQLSPVSMLYYDAVLICSFALAGLYCYSTSLKGMQILWQPYVSKRGFQIINFCIPFITAFGIYLGRFLRFNSWDIITAPLHLFKKIGDLIINPGVHKIAWAFIVVFGISLWLLSFFKTRISSCVIDE